MQISSFMTSDETCQLMSMDNRNDVGFCSVYVLLKGNSYTIPKCNSSNLRVYTCITQLILNVKWNSIWESTLSIVYLAGEDTRYMLIHRSQRSQQLNWQRIPVACVVAESLTLPVRMRGFSTFTPTFPLDPVLVSYSGCPYQPISGLTGLRPDMGTVSPLRAA